MTTSFSAYIQTSTLLFEALSETGCKHNLQHQKLLGLHDVICARCKVRNAAYGLLT